ncbi:MAG: RusA family crossover junction endodeoxyribonuclease [Burkholderiaceae bacterium]|nr:RusA family crossover junction endodeoxyribonuclease [Burkholderiaceae bacterium]
MLISREGRAYRHAVAAADAGAHRFDADRLDVQIVVQPPDRRRRDLDNILKAPLDAMQAAGVYADDSQIDRLLIERGAVVRDGRLLVRIHPVVQFIMPDADDVEWARRQFERVMHPDFRGCSPTG